MHTHDASAFYDAPISRTGKPSIPPIIVSCASCERTIGDSTAFVAGSRDAHTITFSEVVSVTTGEGKLETARTGDWDEFCNYMTLYCEKCGEKLGRRYYAVMNHLMHLQGKFTLDVPKLSFYQLGAKAPSMPVAETAEIMGLIQPKPDELGEKLAQVMMLCMWLREEQEGMMRALWKLGRSTAIDLSEDLPAEETPEEELEQVEPEWKTKYEELEQRMEQTMVQMEQLKDNLKAIAAERQEETRIGSRRQSERLEESDDEPVRKRHKGRPSTGGLRGGQATASPQPRPHAFSNFRSESIPKEPESQQTKTPSQAPLKVIVDNNSLSRKPPQGKQPPTSEDYDEDMRQRNRERAKETSADVVTILDSQDETEPSTTQESARYGRHSLGGTSDTDRFSKKPVAKPRKLQEKRRSSGRATRQLK